MQYWLLVISLIFFLSFFNGFSRSLVGNCFLKNQIVNISDFSGHMSSAAPAAPATKSLQSCLTLWGPTDGSPPGSPVPGILQARTLEWVAISFSNAGKGKVKVNSLSRVRLLATPWTAAYQAPPSMGFSRQEYWSGVPLPFPIWTLLYLLNFFNWKVEAAIENAKIIKNDCFYFPKTGMLPFAVPCSRV